MENRILWMLAAILTFCGAVLLTSCSEEDNPVVDPETFEIPQEEQLEGKWYCECKVEGTIGEGDNAQHYDKVVMIVYWYNAGFWFRIPMNGDTPVKLGKEKFGGLFDHTIADDGTITATMNFPFMGNPNIDKVVMHYANGHLKGFSGYENFDMTHATDEQEDYCNQLLEIILGNEYSEGSAGDETGVNDIESPDGFKWDGNGLDNDEER